MTWYSESPEDVVQSIRDLQRQRRHECAFEPSSQRDDSGGFPIKESVKKYSELLVVISGHQGLRQ